MKNKQARIGYTGLHSAIDGDTVSSERSETSNHAVEQRISSLHRAKGQHYRIAPYTPKRTGKPNAAITSSPKNCSPL